MKLYPELVENHAELSQWRRGIHAHPELGFEEIRTAEFVIDKLNEVGIEVHSGLGKTGVVGTLTKGNEGKIIGLRADMDALPMQELNNFDHKSVFDGKFHGCGHDGHTIMLLAAARHLSQHAEFNGTVNFIFQPAEEGKAGAYEMIKEGLFEKFSVAEVYSMHNHPGMKVGSFATRKGPMMAAIDRFDVTITGVGGHGALPQHCVDPIIIAAQVVQALQTIVSRSLDTIQPAVVSVTAIHAGDSHSVIPAKVKMSGAIRYLLPDVGVLIKRRMTEIIKSSAEAFGGVGELAFRDLGYPPLINDGACVEKAVRVAKKIVEDSNVSFDIEPIMGSEDFSFMLKEKPGCYICIGSGKANQRNFMPHHPEYDFNDDIIPLGASYWVKLVESELI